MKRTTLILALIFTALSNGAYSQSAQVEPERKEIFIGLNICPSLTWSEFGSYSNIRIYDRSHRFVVNGGIQATFELSNRNCYLETGLLLSDFGFDEIQSDFFFPDRDPIHVTYKNIFASIPVSVIRRFQLLYLGAGLNFSYFIDRQSIVNGQEFNHDTPLTYTYHRSGSRDYWLVGLHVKAGIAAQITSQWLIRPELLFSSVGLNGDGFYNLGAGVSIDYKIR